MSTNYQLHGIFQYASPEEDHGTILAVCPHVIQTAEIRSLFRNPSAVRIRRLTVEDLRHLNLPLSTFHVFMGSRLRTIPPGDLAAFRDFITWNTPFIEHANISVFQENTIDVLLDLFPAFVALRALQLRLRISNAPDYVQVNFSRRNVAGGFDVIRLSLSLINHGVEIRTSPDYIDLGLKILNRMAEVEISEPGRTNIVLQSHSFEPSSIRPSMTSDTDRAAVFQAYMSCFPDSDGVVP
ncbi:hypothetical protein VKT23_014956 [Stygiomarasmius scandens]|uniref:Uncharacterized protein n=1 Tax=Marasmiellus scandens TaxID=2682957 RepID=A0ABR1J283_9AGAR